MQAVEEQAPDQEAELSEDLTDLEVSEGAREDHRSTKLFEESCSRDLH